MTDYLDGDVAYLMGMVIGRGTIVEKEGRWIVAIEFPFIKPELEGYNQFAGFVTSILTRTLPRVKSLLGEAVDISVVPEKRAQFTINLPSTHLVVRNFKQLLGEHFDYSEFTVPTVIEDASEEIAREFVRGFADVAGNIRRANRDQLGLHRVFLDVLGSNWTLPVQMCNLLQSKLKVPVHHILWGHPNLRDPRAKEPTPAWREHQIRIYAHDFLKVGFYIDHKQAILETLAKENQTRREKRRSSFCCGYRRFRRKATHPAEKDKRLPEFLRGKHFDAYWQICAECGCDLAIKALENLRQQGRLI
jgi:hypothetical protein